MKGNRSLWNKLYKYQTLLTMTLITIFILVVVVSVSSLFGTDNKVVKLSNTEIAGNKAEEYFYNREYEKAISEYKKLQREEEWPYYNVKIAEIHSVMGNIEESNRIIEDSIIKVYNLIDNGDKDKYKEDSKEFFNYVIFTYLMNGEYSRALEYGEIFMKEYNSSELQRTMFTVYMVNNLRDKAKDIVKNYKVDASDAYDLSILARMEMLIDNWDNGFENLRKAWYINKDEIKIYDVIAQMVSYNRDDIIRRITELISEDPEEICYKIWLAKCYSMLESTTDEANEVLYQLKDEKIKGTMFNTIKAKIYQHSDRTEEAEEILREIIDNPEESYIGYHTAAWYYVDMGDYEKAFDYCKKSIILNKDYPDNYGFLIPEIMSKTKQELIAEPYFRTAIYKEPFNYNIILKIADYYYHIEEDEEKAYSYFTFASLIKPNDAEILYNMALMNLNSGNNKEAISLIKKCIEINKSTSKYHRTLGTIYLGMEENTLGIEEIRQAYATDKTDILTLNNAGCYYISIEANLQRGLINLEAAYNGITALTDKETKDIITENYNKAKEIYERYKNYDGAQITIPEFELFY